MEWKARKWVAVILGLLVPPLAMLYLARPRLALAYVLASIAIGAIEFFAIGPNRYPWQQYLSLTFFVGAAGAVHAFKIASQNRSLDQRPWYSRWYGLASVALVVFTAMFALRAFLFEPFRMPGESMFPSIPKGSLFVVKKLGYGDYAAYGIRVLRMPPSAKINRGDVIAFHDPKNPELILLKRVVGLPGDRIQYMHEGLVVNGVSRTANEVTTADGHLIRRETLGDNVYEIASIQGERTPDFEAAVPAGHLFVLGDNRDSSSDSRHWGPVPIEVLVGKVVYVHK
jgi:signal peptidase I